jgi:hypothetical protein
MSCRLETALRANRELTAQLSDERRANAQHRARDASDREHEIGSVQSQCQHKIKSLEATLRASQEEQEKKELQLRLLENKSGI